MALVLVVLARVASVSPAGERLLEATGYLAALSVLWQNRAHAWTLLIFAGLGLNGLVIAANGGRMPITEGALLQVTQVVEPEVAVAGLDLDPRHAISGPRTWLGALGDVVPLRVGDFGVVLSPGDILMAIGLAGFVQRQMRAPGARAARGP